MTTVGDMMYHLGGVPVTGELTTGTIFWVDSATGSNSNDGTDIDHPVADIDYANAKCTANSGDIIYVFPGHAETASTQITLDVPGVTVIGLGRGRARPAITAHASGVDLVNVSAASVHLENIRLIGATSCSALINLAAGGDDFSARKLSLEHGAAPTTAVTVNADRFSFRDCYWLGTADGPAYGIAIEITGKDDWEVIDCVFNYARFGLDSAGIACNADLSEGQLITGCKFMGMTLTAVDFNSSSVATVPRGMISHCDVTGFAGFTVANAIDAGSLGIIECYLTDAVAARGFRIPASTPN